MKSLFGGNPGNKIRASNVFTPRWAQPPRRNANQWLDLMMKSPRTNPMHKIASDVAKTPYKLLVKNTDPVREIKKHIALDLLDKPCPDPTITRRNLFYLTEMYILSPEGQAFWLIERNGLGVPSEIWIVPPNWVMQTPTLTIPYFRVLPMGNLSYQMMYVDPNDMIWFKQPDLLNPYGRGRGRSEGIGDEIETDEYMAKWQKQKFFNDAVPPYLVTMEGADEPTMDRAEQRWYEKFGGLVNKFKIAFINWKADVKKLADTEQEMDFIKSRQFLRDTCLQHYSMSGELFGILENANRSTIDLAYELYAKNTLSNELMAFDDTLNRQFFPQFDERLYIEHENVVPNDKKFDLERDTEGLKYGGLTVDEWRIGQGKEPLPDGKGNVLYTPLNMVPTDLNKETIIDNSPAAPENQSDNPKMVSKALTEEHKARIWKSFDAGAVKWEKKLEKDLKKYFQKQQDALTKALSEKGISNINTKDIDSPDDVDSLIDWDKEIKELLELLTPYYIATGEEGFNVASDLYNLDFQFDGIVKPELMKWIKENGLNRCTQMTDTTKTALRKTLAEGIEAGESLINLRDRVSAEYSTIKSTRAMTIARNETMSTVDTGNYLTMKSAGFKKHSWLNSRDGKVRDSHKIDGEKVDIGKKFSNGLLYPHDPNGSADNTVNCRCTTIAEVEDEE